MIKRILTFFGVTIASFIALIFTFIELRFIFSLDFMLLSNPVVAFFEYFFKALYFLNIIALSTFIVIFNIKKKKICVILFAMAISLLIGGCLSFIVYDYFISLIILLASIILVIITSFGFFSKENKSCLINEK